MFAQTFQYFNSLKTFLFNYPVVSSCPEIQEKKSVSEQLVCI